MLVQGKLGEANVFHGKGRRWYYTLLVGNQEAVGPFKTAEAAKNAVVTGLGWDYVERVWDHIPPEGPGGVGKRRPSKETTPRYDPEGEEFERWSKLMELAQERHVISPESIGARATISPVPLRGG